jgi:hypothetical protein
MMDSLSWVSIAKPVPVAARTVTPLSLTKTALVTFVTMICGSTPKLYVWPRLTALPLEDTGSTRPTRVLTVPAIVSSA